MGTKCLSLVEVKKQQWAREKEELAHLCGPWGSSQNCRDEFRPSIRTRFASTSHINLTVPESITSSDSRCTVLRRRSPSLPPIHNTQKHDTEIVKCEKYNTQEEDAEGETSGYASDSGGNEAWNLRHDNWIKEARRFGREGAWVAHREYGTPDSMLSTPGRLWSYSTADEASRLKWGDRGIGVGHLWEPTLHEPESRLPQVQGGPPSWLERGLNKMSEVLVINHSPEQYDRQTTASTTYTDTTYKSVKSECVRSYLLGQNAQLEPDILLEREQKRQRALEHQNSIRLQMEEKERKRKEEKERLRREEQLEDEKIRRDQQIEQQRYEEEQRRQKEKEEKEARKAKVMREALETAERLAKEKNHKSWKHVENPEVNLPTCQQDKTNDSAFTKTVYEKTNSRTVPHISDSTQTDTTISDGVSSISDGHTALSATPGNVQLALLVAPSSVATGLRHHFLLPSSMDNETWMFNQKRQCFISARECGTQTEEFSFSKRSEVHAERKMCANSHKSCKLPLRCNSQSQSSKKIEERPKWGVNQPCAQYIKQSERDPFYLRKLSQRQHRRSMNDHTSRSPGKNKHERKQMEERRVQVIVPSSHRSEKDDEEEDKISVIPEQLSLKGRRLHRSGLYQERARQWPPVKDILSQLSCLKQGLILKQREWQPSRSQTPYSELS